MQIVGEVVWAANSDARSDNKYVDEQGMTHKYSSGDAMGLILDEDTFLRTHERSGHNELVVAEWNIGAIVVDFQRLKESAESVSGQLTEVAQLAQAQRPKAPP